MHLLFLCSQNKRRSLTAEKLFDGQDGHQARSAGTENNARIKLTPGLIGHHFLHGEKTRPEAEREVFRYHSR